MYGELIKTTVTLAGNYHVTPFEIMAQDTDEVIMLINYLLDLGQTAPKADAPTAKKQKDAFWVF